MHRSECRPPRQWTRGEEAAVTGPTLGTERRRCTRGILDSEVLGAPHAASSALSVRALAEQLPAHAWRTVTWRQGTRGRDAVALRGRPRAARAS
jgi:hypothetical protein